MTETNSSADAVDRAAGTPKVHWDDERHERSKPTSLAMGLLGLLALALVIAGGAVVPSLLNVAF
jgi:hypothetical protein